MSFFLIPDHFKTKEMRIRAVEVDPWQLYNVSEWFVVLQEMQYEDFDDDDEFITRCNAYKKRKAQKPQIKEELMHIAWHPDHMMNWCMSEDEKRWWK